MKTKNLFSLGIAILALTACSENEITEQNPDANKAIGFDTYTGVQTRGTEVDLPTLKTSSFGVTAYQTTGDYSTSGAKSEFIKNANVNWNDVQNAWTYSPLKYWPAGTNEKVSFFAYAPYDSNDNSYGITLVSADANNNPKISFSLQQYQNYMWDLIVSNPEDATNNTMNMNSASGTVKFKFQHPLTRVAMVAKTDKNYGSSDTKIFITGVSLIHTNKLNSKGTLDMKTLTWADNTTDYVTSPYVLDAFDNGNPDSGILDLTAANFAGYTTSSIDISAGGTTATSLFIKEFETNKDHYLFLLPVNNGTGTANAGDVKVKIAYDIVNKTGTATHTKSSVEKELNLPAGVFKKGVAHKFIFTIGLNAISFDVATDMGWGTVTDNDITVQ